MKALRSLRSAVTEFCIRMILGMPSKARVRARVCDAGQKTYSFKNVTVAIAHPLAGPFLSNGQIGLSEIMVSMALNKTEHTVASDSTVLPSFISGDNGTVTIHVLQTSQAHTYLQGWYNIIKSLADNGNVDNWASMALTIRSQTDGSSHVCTGISPMKVPDKNYRAQAQTVTVRESSINTAAAAILP